MENTPKTPHTFSSYAEAKQIVIQYFVEVYGVDMDDIFIRKTGENSYEAYFDSGSDMYVYFVISE